MRVYDKDGRLIRADENPDGAKDLVKKLTGKDAYMLTLKAMTALVEWIDDLGIHPLTEGIAEDFDIVKSTIAMGRHLVIFKNGKRDGLTYFQTSERGERRAYLGKLIAMGFDVGGGLEMGKNRKFKK